MKTLKASTILPVLIIALITACGPYDCLDCGNPVDADVVLMDAKGNPLKNRELFVSGSVYEQTQTTDENGHAHFEFFWSPAIKDAHSCWAIQAKEDQLIMVNLILSPNVNGRYSEGKYLVRDTIIMDSLTKFKIRVKTSRNDLKGLYFKVGNDGLWPLDNPFYCPLSGPYGLPQSGTNLDYSVRQPLKREFLTRNFFTNTPQLDTTINLKVYANTAFQVDCNVGYWGEPKSEKKNITIDATASRDSVLLIEF